MSISLAISSPGAIPDLTTLKSTVSDWLDRNDLDAKLPAFIQMAEALFNRELRCPEMEATTAASVTSEDSSLPDDYLAMRAIYIEASPDRPLRAMSPTAIKHEFNGQSAPPVAYALVGGGIRLAPPPNSATLLTMDYYAQIAPLSVFAPANWLLQKHPDAYLYATLFYAEAYLDNAERAAMWKGLLGPKSETGTEGIIDRINKTARNNRYGAGPLVPNATAQVRNARC